jgi:hypothetical protein
MLFDHLILNGRNRKKIKKIVQICEDGMVLSFVARTHGKPRDVTTNN